MIVGTSEFPHAIPFFCLNLLFFLTPPLSFGLLLRGQAESSNVMTVVLLLFKLENKEKLDKELISLNRVL